jgi:hypothetical protein
VNPASATRALRPGAWRGRTSQPGPAFPQLPGIIFENPDSDCSPCPDVSVLVSYPQPMNSAGGHTDMTLCRFPDSEIDGSTPVNGSPSLVCSTINVVDNTLSLGSLYAVGKVPERLSKEKNQHARGSASFE